MTDTNKDTEFNDQSETDPLKREPKKKVILRQRLTRIKRNITVEPSASLFLMSSILAAITTQTLNLDKACRVNLDFGDAVCDALRARNTSSYTEEEKVVQAYTASRLAWKGVIQSVIPCTILLFVGAWSDKTGRRTVLILMPIAGEIMQCVNNIINVYFFYQLPLEVLIFFEAFFPAISGGWITLFLGVFSYISNVTTNETRTYRLGYASFCMYVGIPIGMALSGFMLKKTGYYGVYATSICLHLLNFGYTYFVLRDPPRTSEQTKHDNRGCKYFIRTFFDLANIRETMKVVFKKGNNNRRVRICVLLAIVAILFGPMYGEISIMYLSTRFRFNWDEVKFSIFSTYNFVTHTIGTIFSITVFSKQLNWHDSILGIISTVSKIAASFIYCFAKSEKVFFAAPLVEILNGTSLLAMRSILSKLVSPDELGKLNSIFGLTENLMPLVYVPLYTRVYMATLEVLPGAVFLMGAAMTMPAVAVFCWLLYEHRRNVKLKKREIIEEETNKHDT